MARFKANPKKEINSSEELKNNVEVKEEKQEISYKDYLMNVYAELDAMDAEEIKAEIEVLKQQILDIVEEYEKVLKEKDAKVLEKIKDDGQKTEIRKHHSKTNQIIISTPRMMYDFSYFQIAFIISIIVIIGFLVFFWGKSLG